MASGFIIIEKVKMTSRLLCTVLLVCVFVVFGKNTPLIEPHREEQSTKIPKDKIKTDAGTVAVPSSDGLPKPTAAVEDDENSLAEALRVLERRKREISRVHRPYSSFKPLGAHRYRYPLYKKRAAYYAPEYYDYGDSLDSFDDYNSYLEDLEKPSLFRERERGPVPELISNAHFSSKPIYHKRKTQNLPSQFIPAKNLHFNLDTAPYDLNVMGKLYELGKRAENSPTKPRHLEDRFFDPSQVDDRNFGQTHYLSKENARDKIYTDLLNNAVDDYSNKEAGLQTSVIRRQKRASTPSAVASNQAEDNNNKTIIKSKTNISPKRNESKTERQKRAYDDASIFLSPEEEENDFLTREYFKTIARSVGNKKKRMAFAKFEAQKRSNTFDAFLENPQMLHFVQEQIREAEEEVAKDAENEIQKNGYSSRLPQDDIAAQILLSNSIARLDALERMRESLYQLEQLQEQDAIRKRGQRVLGGFSDEEKEKRRKALRERLVKEGQKEEEEERQKRITEENMRKRKRQREEDEENRRKRKEKALRTLIKGNRKDGKLYFKYF
ncbi:hypothetical protein Anas_10255 [Armadillidium nasatum]|uniref:Uncharacterized protein n=1 Tax=Armadillidium nasatum TaxID=96803 RepID=A0A5N5TD39_9CRUS|nr:hypothetical protein Anas_10255 [Armadillidium nasatum]